MPTKIPRGFYLLALGALPTVSSLQCAPVVARREQWRSSQARCWTGETKATLEIRDVPMEDLYRGYANVERMPEWSPLLSSVNVDAERPNLSVWCMRCPRALRVAAQLLGYPPQLKWEADLYAPGPPAMRWTSVLDGDGKLKGLPNAGFEPSGRVEFEQLGPDLCAMTLHLCYAVPEGTPSWQIALVQSAPVQYVLTSRMSAGLKRFAAQMRVEWQEARRGNGAAVEGQL